MPRIRIDVPNNFRYSTIIPVRITDLNYGGHVGNDNVLSIIHEARVQWLKHLGYEEMNLEGVGLIMSEVVIEFKNELFYGDEIRASVTAGECSKIGFEIFYKLEKQVKGKIVMVVIAKTSMVCYDYERKKIAHLPESVKSRMIS